MFQLISPLRHLFFKTGTPELRTNPLAGESEKGESGVIVEYFSNEMGFVKLDSEDGLVVLFHLNQMWEQKDNKMVMLKEVLDEPLQSLLPLGAPVVLRTLTTMHWAPCCRPQTCPWAWLTASQPIRMNVLGLRFHVEIKQTKKT